MSLVHPFALVPCLLAPLALSSVFAPVRRPAAVALAEAEGLQAHARSIAVRLGRGGQ